MVWELKHYWQHYDGRDRLLTIDIIHSPVATMQGVKFERRKLTMRTLETRALLDAEC